MSNLVVFYLFQTQKILEPLDPFLPHSAMVGNGALSHKIDFITIFEEILNLKGHQNCSTGPRSTPLIFPIGQSGGASRWRVCYMICPYL